MWKFESKELCECLRFHSKCERTVVKACGSRRCVRRGLGVVSAQRCVAHWV